MNLSTTGVGYLGIGTNGAFVSGINPSYIYTGACVNAALRNLPEAPVLLVYGRGCGEFAEDKCLKRVILRIGDRHVEYDISNARQNHINEEWMMLTHIPNHPELKISLKIDRGRRIYEIWVGDKSYPIPQNVAIYTQIH